MKILYLCGSSLAKKRGYVVHTVELARNLMKLGAEVVIIAPSLGRTKEADLKVKYAPVINIKILRFLSSRMSLSILLFWHLLSNQTDVIYVREIPLYLGPYIIGKIFKIPTVIEINNASIDYYIERPKKIFLLMTFYIRKVSFKLAQKIIVANEEVRAILSKKYNINLEKFEIIPMGVNADLFRPLNKELCREKLGLEKHCKYVGFVGTLYPFQGLRYLVEAAPFILEKDRDVKFLIVGSGADVSNIKDLIKKYNLSEAVILAGEKEYSLMPYYINSFDVCISLVTLARAATFSFPIKIYEYISCGRPVLIGNLRNKNVLVNTEVTPVVDAADAGILSGTILDMLARTDNFKDELENLRKLVADNFTWKKTAERTLQLFKSTAGICG